MEDKTYRLTVTLKATDNHRFSRSTDIKINGMSAAIEEVSTQAGGRLIFSVDFYIEAAEDDTLICGDADNDKKIKVNDAVMLFKRVLDENEKTTLEKAYSYDTAMEYLDMDKDNEITARDCALILQEIAK